MKLFTVLFLTAWFFLSLVGSAFSEPVTIAIFGSAFAATFAGQLVSVGLGLAFSYGVGLIQKAMAKRKAKDQTKGISFELQVGDDQPMSFTVGKYAAGGRRKYTGITGDDNRYFIDVIELENIPNPGRPELWVNDQKVTIDWDHPNAYGFGYPVTEFEGYLWVKYHDGTQTSADIHLISKFEFEPDRPFTTDMIGRGCPYLIVSAKFNTELFPNVPTVLTETPIRPFYDLRKDSTNGGSGTHRWNDQSTWEPTQNPIIIIYNIIRGIYYGNEWVYGGQNLAAFRLPASNWIAAANECDVQIPLEGGGTENQFRCGYEIFCDVEPLTVIEEILQGCNGRLAEVGGIFKVMVGAPGAAVFSFTDEDVVVTEGQSFNPFPPFSDTHNGIEATYPEPAEKWATKDAPARYDEDLMEADLGQQLVIGVEFEAVPFKTQVQRLMKVMLLEERRFRSHEFYLPPSAWRLEPNDVVSWTSEKNGYINKKFLVIRVVGQRNFNQLVSLKEIDPSDYDWDSDEEIPTVVGPVLPIVPTPQVMTGWAAVGYTVLDATGKPRRPGIKVSCATNLDDVKNVHVQIYLKYSGELVFDSDATPYGPPYAWVISDQWTLPNTEYQARGKFIPYTSRQTLWSGLIDVLTPNVQLVAEDILDGEIISSKIADGAATADKIANAAITSLKLADAAVTEAKVAVAAINSSAIQNAAITNVKLGALAVDASKIAANAITTIKIADDAISSPKILANAVVADKIAAKAVTTEKMIMGDFTNFVENPNFEEGDVSWVKGTGVFIVENVPANAFIGNNYMAIGVGAPATLVVRNANMFPVVPGATFMGSATVKAVGSPVGSLEARIRFGAANGTTFVGSGTIGTWTSADTTYTTKVSATITAPAGAVYAWFDFVSSVVIAAGAFHVGSTRIQRKNAAELIIDGSIVANHLAAGSVVAGKIQAGAIVAADIAAATITGAKIAADTIGATNIAATSIYAKHLLLTDFTNLVANGNFDSLDLASNWNFFGSGQFVPVFGISQTGSNCALLQKTALTPANDIWITQKPAYCIPVQAGAAYYFETAISTNTSSAPAGFFFRINWLDINKGYLGFYDVAAGAPITATWTKYAAKVTPAAGVYYVQIVIYSNTGNTTAQNLLIDRIIVRKANAAELIVDGSIIANYMAANSITATAIAAGAVTADKLSVGTGGNYLKNSTFSAGFTGWGLEFTNAPAGTYNISMRNDTYGVAPYGSIELRYTGSTPGMVVGVGPFRADGILETWPASPGQWFEMSCYYTGHRSAGLQMYMAMIDVSGNAISYPLVSFPANINIDPQYSIKNYTRAWYKTQCPAGTVSVRPFWRNAGPAAGQTDTYVWIKNLYFGEARANQTEPSPWSDGSMTVISGGNIATSAITADKLNVTSLSAISATLGSVNISSAIIGTLTVGTSNIQAGAVTAFGAGSVPTGAMSGTKVVDITIVHPDSASTAGLIVKVDGYMELINQIGSPNGGFTLTLQNLNSGVILARTQDIVNAGASSSLSCFGWFVPAAGITTSTIRMQVDVRGTVSYNSVFATAFKR